MPNFTPEVREQVSDNRKTLEGSVANLKKLFLVGLASVLISGCSGQRANAVWGSLGYDAASTGVSGLVGYGLNEMLNPPNYNSTNNQRDAIRRQEIYKLKFDQLFELEEKGIITNKQFNILIKSLNKDYEEGNL